MSPPVEIKVLLACLNDPDFMGNPTWDEISEILDDPESTLLDDAAKWYWQHHHPVEAFFEDHKDEINGLSV